jgi:hypothetical protein
MNQEEIQRAFLNAPPMWEYEVDCLERERGCPLSTAEVDEIKRSWEIAFEFADNPAWKILEDILK